MSTFISPDNQPSLFPPVTQAKWLTVPSLGGRMAKRMERTIADISSRLPEGHLVLHRTMRIQDPPRKVEIEIYKYEGKVGSQAIIPLRLAAGQKKDWESICPDFIAVACEISDRWPSRVRPSALALISDGKSLWFNPGRPVGINGEWFTDHLRGESPCAMIYHKSGDYPLETIPENKGKA